MSDIIVKTYNLEGIGSFKCVQVGEGQLCWSTPGFQWKFNEKIAPPQNNVAMYADGTFHYQLRVRTIEFALAYTMGFAYGYRNGVIQGKADVEGVTDMVQKIFEESVDKNKPPVRADDGITGNKVS